MFSENYTDAVNSERFRENASEIPSSDAAIAMNRFGKRPRKPTVLAEFSSEQNITPASSTRPYDRSPPVLHVGCLRHRKMRLLQHTAVLTGDVCFRLILQCFASHEQPPHPNSGYESTAAVQIEVSS
ncbi:hypothetical protein FGIG_05598 [Fasciola gigantica]|uniref:Uncharacterized protein n=1 Tax=Fasciola gigantica TaxID=46835 RepID=A0A504YRI3_FASGI|nr:hypothetical protein FGIG_05598 [Fasciola gigantica]